MILIKNMSFDVKKIVEGAISPFDEYCDGYGCPGSSGNNYVLGCVLGVGKDKLAFNHPGSSILDQINAFDLAEVNDIYIGQLNMSTVSSFCGPQGVIWGYDIAFADFTDCELSSSLKYKNLEGDEVTVYSAKPIVDATRRLFGTRDNKRFVLKPGSHVPFAGRSLHFRGPKKIYSSIAMGIPCDRGKNAVLLMEDIGWIPLVNRKRDLAFHSEYSKVIEDNLVRSVIKVGENHQVAYKSILVAMKEIEIGSNEIGCALVAAPYFSIAKNAIPDSDTGLFSTIKLDEWEQKT